MNVYSTSEKCPIGTKLRLMDDDVGVIHEVFGYEWFADSANIIFKDGGKLNLERMDLIVEVME